MKLMKGDMMSVFDEVDHFIVCVASSLRSDGSATMLNGVAGQLAAKHPGLPAAIGTFIKGECGSCGCFWLRCESKIGVFQSGIMNKDGPNLMCISGAAKRLKEIAEANPEKIYALETPQGKEQWWLIEGIMNTLPENVQVWTPS